MEPRQTGSGVLGGFGGLSGMANSLPAAKPTTIQDLLNQLAQSAESLAAFNARIASAVAQGNGSESPNVPPPTPSDIESRLYEISRLISVATLFAEKTLKCLGV